MSKNILVTGSAGFIGFHVSKHLLDLNFKVVGLDCFSDYYDVNLKNERSKILRTYKNFTEIVGKIEDENIYNEDLNNYPFNAIIHLAAQAGVRYSIEFPEPYLNSNILGTFRILEFSRKKIVNHLLCASTSSVYGSNREMPFKENQNAYPIIILCHQKSNEVMAHSYSHIHNIPITMFRFLLFMVRGDVQTGSFKFTNAILNDKPILFIIMEK